MKIGIITFHASNNCGSMLQSYALQQTLNKMEYKNEIIDFSNEAQQHMYALLRRPQNFHDVLYNAATLAYYKLFKRHFNDYKSFIKEFLTLGYKSYSYNKELEELNSVYDVFITGSDQVWNPSCPDADDAYYLNFVEGKKKIAYAPSFGATSIVDKVENSQKYKKYIDDFDAVSIRENNGAKWIKELTGREVPVLVDPTLLLSKDEYEALAEGVEIPQEKYIFYYAFKYSDEVNKVVKTISEEYDMPVYILDAKNWVKKAKQYGFKVTKGSGPKTFIKFLFGAELVLTTSFHGTVFSIIGNKKFWFIDSSMHNADDDRAQTLLDMFGLTCRMKTGDKILEDDIMKPVDYTDVDKKMKDRKEQACDFLKKALS